MHQRDYFENKNILFLYPKYPYLKGSIIDIGFLPFQSLKKQDFKIERENNRLQT